VSAAASASASRFSAVERLLPSQLSPVVHEDLLEVPGDRLVLDDDACVAIPKYAIRRLVLAASTVCILRLDA
jgi:hypothetical protein